MKNSLLPVLLALLAIASNAHAHVVLEQKEAEAGSLYKAVFKVGHGCEGSATNQIVVTLPAGLRGARPTPKPGWTLTRSATEISWAARTDEDILQDDWYDEFVLRGTLPEQPGELWFKVRQVCVKGESNWAEVPADGLGTKGMKMPAAHVTVTPRTSAAPPQQAH